MDATQMIRVTGEATGEIDAGDLSPIRVFGTESIRNQFDDGAIKQAINCRNSPGVSDVAFNPDAHEGHALIGCVMASPTNIYPGPVGVDIKCSMSLLQFDLPESEILDKKLRRAPINAIMSQIPPAGWNERDCAERRGALVRKMESWLSRKGLRRRSARKLDFPSTGPCAVRTRSTSDTRIRVAIWSGDLSGCLRSVRLLMFSLAR